MNAIRPKIAIGYRVGYLTVTAPGEQRKGGYTVWKCSCDCGGELLLDTRALQRGAVRDCGCRTRVSPGQTDLTQRRFGMLLALSPTDRRSCGRIVWRCACDCGKEAYVSSNQLLSGYVKSCGCLSHPPLKNFVGKRFGKLTVLSYEGKRDGMHRWKCRCDCGKETVVGQTLLQSGKTRSCGCLKAEVLHDNIQFVDGTSVTQLEAILKHDKLRPGNTSGYTGVYRSSKGGKWVAQIVFKGKAYYLGTYERKEEALKVRLEAEEKTFVAFLQWYHERRASTDLGSAD